MLNLLQNLYDDFEENEFLTGFIEVYSNRDDRKGYLYAHADPVLASLIENKSEAMRVPDEINVLLQKPDFDKLRETVPILLTDSLILGYLAQVFYVEWVSERVKTHKLPPLKKLVAKIHDYKVRVGEYWPLNNFLDDLVNNVEKRVKTAAELATLGEQRSVLAKDVRHNAYTGQVIAILQGYTVNMNNLKD